jgi:hypothetical protein
MQEEMRSPPNTQPYHWYDDVDNQGTQYGVRGAAPEPFDFYTNNFYFGFDEPNGPPTPGYKWMFRLVVIDICNGRAKIYTSKPITVTF